MKNFIRFGILVICLLIFIIVLLFISKRSGNFELSDPKSVCLQLTTVCENSSTRFNYNYAEKLESFDGRGITFGIVGFTTGTYDGNQLIHYYTQLNPNNNLAKYIPALDKIDNDKHDSYDKNNDITGLDNFIKDINNCSDPLFKKAQMYKLDQLYWEPSVQMADDIGAKNLLTLAFIYDMCVNHSEDGAQQFIDNAINELGGTPDSGVDENKFLSKLMEDRYAFLLKDDPKGSGRVAAYKKLLKKGNVKLKTQFKFVVYGETFKIDGNVY